jgi:hypothetical protein
MIINHTAVGVFDDPMQAMEAVRALRATGFDDTHIGMVSRNDTRADAERSGLQDDPTYTRWEEGSGVGAAAGAVTGVGLGLAVAAGLIPGVGPIIAGGTLVALLASAGTGAAVGTVLGALVGLGIPEDEATFYESEVAAGKTVVTVHSPERVGDAEEILRTNGALERATA